MDSELCIYLNGRGHLLVQGDGGLTDGDDARALVGNDGGYRDLPSGNESHGDQTPDDR